MIIIDHDHDQLIMAFVMIHLTSTKLKVCGHVPGGRKET